MKSRFLFAILFLFSCLSFSQNIGINYKALIKDSGGNVVANQNITLQFIIYEGVALTNNVYQETHSPMTDANGIVIVNIGEGTTSDVFTNIDWGEDDHYLNVQIDTGSGLTDMGTTQFMAVPYALHANNVAVNTIKIDDLSDGKSDSDGTDVGSSIFLGLNAGLNDDSSNNNNVGIGFHALFSNITGSSNIAMGSNALYSNTTGYKNTATGFQTLYSNTVGISNTATGSGALSNNTSGYANTATGAGALSYNITGNFNTATGIAALINNTTGINNTASGYEALLGNKTGDDNTAIGTHSLSSSESGTQNVAVGVEAGYGNVIGLGNIFIGYQSGYSETGSNRLYVENSNADADNALIYGEFDNDILRANGIFQVGNPSGTGFAFPTLDGSSGQILKTDGNGALSWVNGSSLGAQKINDLTDGKSDNDGSQNGSSLYLGMNAGTNDDSSDNKNVGIGFEALYSNTAGGNNTASGYYSLYNNTFGNDNTANGYRSLYSNTEGINNTSNGSLALYSNTQGNNNTSNGYAALYANTIGNYNTASGYEALYSNTSGMFNTANGAGTLIYNTSGNYNTANGANALLNNSTGINNTASGYGSLTNNTIGTDNTAVGFSSLFSNTSGIKNVAIGFEALYSNTTGPINTAIGYQALYSNISGLRNTATGYKALFNTTTGSGNTAIGTEALINNTSGYSNIAIGYRALNDNTTGNSNVASGVDALYRNSTGINNTANGFSALHENTIGNDNTSIGIYSLFSNTSGEQNVAIGSSAGYSNVGLGNIFMGYRSGFYETGNNKLYIENSNADANNALIYGEFDNDIFRTNGIFQIGNPSSTGFAFPTSDGSASQILQTNGSGSLSWTDFSAPTGLEALDEGNGTGWRLIGSAPANYGNIGEHAVDLSYSSSASSNRGATGSQSVAMGYRTTASGDYSTAIGNSTTAFNYNSIAIGVSAIALAEYSTALGIGTTASGTNAMVMGYFSKADSYNSTAMGCYNIGGGTFDSWVATDPLFEIGNGTDDLARANALTVLKNGKVGIGTNTPTTRLHITGGSDANFGNGSGFLVIGAEDGVNIVIDNNEIIARNNGTTSPLFFQNDGGDVYVGGAVVHSSDRRLKQDIVDLNYGLEEVLKLRPVAYHWKANANALQKELGLIAQEVKPLIGELVGINDQREHTLTLNYEGLIPVLIKAIQEQQEIIEGQKIKIEAQNTEIKSLKSEFEARLKHIEETFNTAQQ